MCERKGEDASKEFSFRIMSSAAGFAPPYLGDTIPRSSLISILASCERLALGNIMSTVQQGGSGRMEVDNGLEAIVDGAMLLSSGGRAGPGLDLEGFLRWSKAWPMVQELLSSLLKGIALDAPRDVSLPTLTSSGWSRIPGMLDLGRARPEDLLLQPLSCWMLSACLPPSEIGLSN